MPTVLTPAQRALSRGLGILKSLYPVSFTVERIDAIFTGTIEDTRTSSDLGEGGFLFTTGGQLTVDRDEFARFGIVPWDHMRVRLWDRNFEVSTISENPIRWVLTLVAASPDNQSLVPVFVLTLQGVSGDLLFTTGNAPIAITQHV